MCVCVYYWLGTVLFHYKLANIFQMLRASNCRHSSMSCNEGMLVIPRLGWNTHQWIIQRSPQYNIQIHNVDSRTSCCWYAYRPMGCCKLTSLSCSAGNSEAGGRGSCDKSSKHSGNSRHQCHWRWWSHWPFISPNDVSNLFVSKLVNA